MKLFPLRVILVAFDVFEMNCMKITQVTLHELRGFDLEVQIYFFIELPKQPSAP